MGERAESGYMDCAIYAEHGACSCSTGVPGNVCPLGLQRAEPVAHDEGGSTHD